MTVTLTINTKEWDAMRARIAAANGHRVRVGVLASKGGSAPHDDDSEISLIELAAIHEFGSPAANIPERSYIRATMNGNEVIKSAIVRLSRALIAGRVDYVKALTILGEIVVAEIRKRITLGEGVPPPLKEATIARKGSSRPLVDTGRLVNAITYEVVAAAAARELAP